MNVDEAIEVLRRYEKENTRNESATPPPTPEPTSYLKKPEVVAPPKKARSSWQEFVFDADNKKKYKYSGIPRKDSPQYAKLRKAYDRKQKANKKK